MRSLAGAIPRADDGRLAPEAEGTTSAALRLGSDKSMTPFLCRPSFGCPASAPDVSASPQLNQTDAVRQCLCCSFAVAALQAIVDVDCSRWVGGGSWNTEKREETSER